MKGDCVKSFTKMWILKVDLLEGHGTPEALSEDVLAIRDVLRVWEARPFRKLRVMKLDEKDYSEGRVREPEHRGSETNIMEDSEGK